MNLKTQHNKSDISFIHCIISVYNKFIEKVATQKYKFKHKNHRQTLMGLLLDMNCSVR